MQDVRPGWQKQKRESFYIPGTVEVAYSYKKIDDSLWMVISDHNGVTMRGESPAFNSAQGLEHFAWVLSDAMREHMNLKKARIAKPN